MSIESCQFEDALRNVKPVPCDAKQTFCRIQVSNVDSWLSKMLELKSKPDCHWVFRGQCEHDWPITSSFERFIFRDDNNVKCCFNRYPLAMLRETFSEIERMLLNVERNLMDEFVRRFQAHQPKDIQPKTRLEWCSLMQHHGLPTRLIDFTRDPKVALCFAAYGAYESRYSIWIVNSEKCRQTYQTSTYLHESVDFKGMDDLEIAEKILTMPVERLCNISQNSSCMLKIEPRTPNQNQRMRVQDGLFMMPMSLSVPVEATFNNNVAEVLLSHMMKDENGEYASKPISWEVALYKWDRFGDFKAIQFIFDAGSRDSAKKILLKHGIDTNTLFPDASIDFDAYYIKSEYESRLKKESFLEKMAELYRCFY